MMNRLLTLLLTASCLTAVGQVPDYVPTEGLVAWFDFGLGQEDQSGNLELILNGGAQLADGVLDVSQSGAWAESNALPPSLEGAPAFSVVAVLQSQMSHYDAASWGIGGGSPTQNINSWNHSSGEAANQVTIDLWGETTFGSGLEYSQEEFDVALWTKTAGNFSAGNILLGLNDQIVGGPDLTALRNGLDLPDLPEGGKLYLGKAGLEDNYYGPFKIKIFGLFDRALDVEEYLLLRFNMMEELGGCTDISACNYSPEAFFDDGSCESFGCMDSHACNFSAEAACDDGSCDYSCCPGPGCCDVGTEWSWVSNTCVVANPSDSNFDGCVQLNDLLDLLSAYGDCSAEESAWQCGDPLEYQGYDYETVLIGEQCWFAENLQVTNFLDGSAIPHRAELEPFSVLPSFSFPGVDDELQAVYGLQYNWNCIVDPRLLCPTGFRVPSHEDFVSLVNVMGGEDTAGSSLKSQGVVSEGGLWMDGALYNSNSSGFSARPAGWGYQSGPNNLSFGLNAQARFWKKTLQSGNGETMDLVAESSGANHNLSPIGDWLSVRCIKD